jgi:hypothetical protein
VNRIPIAETNFTTSATTTAPSERVDRSFPISQGRVCQFRSGTYLSSVHRPMTTQPHHRTKTRHDMTRHDNNSSRERRMARVEKGSRAVKGSEIIYSFLLNAIWGRCRQTG